MPRKLGQHFLVNRSAIQKIIASLELKNGEVVIEIGPGKGALTFPLVKQCQVSGIKCQVIGIEKDSSLIEDLKLKIENSNHELIHGDALKMLPKIIFNLKSSILNYKIVGNIPYYITGKLLRVISELENKPTLTVLTIQREVAERIIAKPLKMNLLAAAVQFWAEPKIIGYLKPSDFSPAPEVKSAIIQLDSRVQSITNKETERYYKFIKIAFKQPRKTLLNNLSSGLSVDKSKIAEILAQNALKSDVRPQDLSIEKLSTLSRLLIL
ncbi:MAG: 16S rRNA (adenine(1518)-N(6)/adenine(1519)-N(6))-dimethyltransferase RsmA [Patescibacteria group bacterium]